jgi:ribosomal protein S18 acetylase RimI-like enzyme
VEMEVPHVRMSRPLGEPIETPNWPDGVYLEAFTAKHSADAHALLELTYTGGGGSVPPFDEWWSLLSRDSEYDPQLCFLARDDHGHLVAFAQCWNSAFVKDFVVHPRYQRRGIGRALLLHVFRIFQERHAQSVDLKVHIDSPSGAVQFYEGLGMLKVSN